MHVYNVLFYRDETSPFSITNELQGLKISTWIFLNPCHFLQILVQSPKHWTTGAFSEITSTDILISCFCKEACWSERYSTSAEGIFHQRVPSTLYAIYVYQVPYAMAPLHFIDGILGVTTATGIECPGVKWSVLIYFLHCIKNTEEGKYLTQ